MNTEPELKSVLNEAAAKTQNSTVPSGLGLIAKLAAGAFILGATNYMSYDIGHMNGHLAAREKGRSDQAQATVEDNSRQISHAIHTITSEQFWADKRLSNDVAVWFGLQPSMHAYTNLIENENIEVFKVLQSDIGQLDSGSIRYILHVASTQDFKNPVLKKEMIQILVDHGAEPYQSTIDAIIEQERPDLLAMVLKNSKSIWVSHTFDSIMNHNFKDPSVKDEIVKLVIGRDGFKPSQDDIRILIAQGQSGLLPLVLDHTGKYSIPEDALYCVVSSEKFPNQQAQRDMMRAFMDLGAKAGPRAMSAIASRNRGDLYDMAVHALADWYPEVNLKGEESIANGLLRNVLFRATESGDTAAASFVFDRGVILDKTQAYYYFEQAKRNGQPDIAKIIADRTKTPAAPNPSPAP